MTTCRMTEESCDPFTVLSGLAQRLQGPPERLVSQQGGPAESGGLCDDFRPAGVDAGSGSPLSGPSCMARPCRGALPEKPGLLPALPGKNTPASGHMTVATDWSLPGTVLNSSKMLVVAPREPWTSYVKAWCYMLSCHKSPLAPSGAESPHVLFSGGVEAFPPGSGVFAGYSLCYASVGGGVSRPASALYSLTFLGPEAHLVKSGCASERRQKSTSCQERRST